MITHKGLKLLFSAHKYIILVKYDNTPMGVNCAVALKGANVSSYSDTAVTMFVSFHECSFQKYISEKIPFIVLD